MEWDLDQERGKLDLLLCVLPRVYNRKRVMDLVHN